MLIRVIPGVKTDSIQLTLLILKVFGFNLL